MVELEPVQLAEYERRDRGFIRLLVATTLRRLGQIDMQRPGKQQEAEHPLQQRVREIQLVEQIDHPVIQLDTGDQRVGNHQANRRQRAHHRQSDDMRQLQEMMIEIAKQRRCHHQQGGDVERFISRGSFMHGRRHSQQACIREA